jgi:hypothetical protein
MQVLEHNVTRGAAAAQFFEAVCYKFEALDACSGTYCCTVGHGAAQLVGAVLQAGSPECKFRNIPLYGGHGEAQISEVYYKLEILDASSGT